MGKYVFKDLGNLTADGTTTPVDVSEIEAGARVQITGTFGGGSAQLQISLDGSLFSDFGTALTADGLVDTALPKCKEVQIVLSGATGPDINGAIGGDDLDRLG